MSSSLIGGLVAVAAVVVVALALRAMGGEKTGGSVPAAPPAPPAPEPVVDDGDEAIDEDHDGIDDRLVVAVSSNGQAFVPDAHSVAVVPSPEEGEEWKEGADVLRSGRRAALANAWRWHAGDMHGLRVVPGAPEEGPWRLEALGRDGEYITFIFETPEAANAAKELFERQHVVHLGHDEDGRPMPPSAEQFAEARRIYLETESQLDLPDEESGERQGGTP